MEELAAACRFTDCAHEREPGQQVALQTISVLEFIDQKISIPLRNARQHRRVIEQTQRAQLQVVKVENRQALLFVIEPPINLAQQFQDRERITPGQQIEADRRQLASQTVFAL